VVGGPPLANSPTGERFRYYLYCRQRASGAASQRARSVAEPDWFTPYCPLRHVTSEYPPPCCCTAIRYRRTLSAVGAHAQALRHRGWRTNC